MKKTILAFALILPISQISYATQNRITALGGDAIMITNDDTNIEFFPQHINKQNLIRIRGIDTIGAASPNAPTTTPTAGTPVITPGYAMIVGEKGKKWGLFGGTTMSAANFLSVYRSLDENSAIKLGARISRGSQTVNHDGNETTADITSEENSYFSLMVDGVYGRNVENQEQAIRGYFAYGPGTIALLAGTGAIGTYNSSDKAGAVTTTSSGEANTFAVGGNAYLRKPMANSIFKKVPDYP